MNQNINPKVLLIYIEPTPYVLDLLLALKLAWHGHFDVLFLSENVSQHWNMEYDTEWGVLPKSFIKKIQVVYQLVFKKKYKIIHIAGWSEPILQVLLIFAKFAKIPVVIESDTPFQPTKLWKRIIKKLYYPQLFRLASLFLPGGKRQAKYIEYFGIKSSRIIPVQMTVDVSTIKNQAALITANEREYTRKLYGINEKSIVFIFVGRLVEHKGLRNLLTVFKNLKNDQAVLLIVGDGTMRQQVEHDASIHSNIRYAGRLSGNKLITTFHAADTLVLPSFMEPWGLVVNEAMALGLPVIVSDRVGCIDDLVFDQKTGLIINATDVEQLQQAIEDLANNHQKRIAMGKQAALHIADWTLENEAKNICQAWAQI
jgi:glycosyltransferase involved in cell wall biosynthesis